jgi:hypothetical protein
VREEAIKMLNAVAELRARPYWNRARIVQELVLAQKVLVWFNMVLSSSTGPTSQGLVLCVRPQSTKDDVVLNSKFQ